MSVLKCQQTASSKSTPQATPSASSSNRNGITANGTGASAKDASLPPLPEGWTEVFSRTQQKVFYHNKALNLTKWDRPVAERERPTTPPLEERQARESKEGDVSSGQAAGSKKDEKNGQAPGSDKANEKAAPKTAPSGPSAKKDEAKSGGASGGDSNVANAYAKRRQPASSKDDIHSSPGPRVENQQQQPRMREWGKAAADTAGSKAGDANIKPPILARKGVAGRQRSRSPSPRPDESKRVRTDSGGKLGDNRTFALFRRVWFHRVRSESAGSESNTPVFGLSFG